MDGIGRGDKQNQEELGKATHSTLPCCSVGEDRTLDIISQEFQTRFLIQRGLCSYIWNLKGYSANIVMYDLNYQVSLKTMIMYFYYPG